MKVYAADDTGLIKGIDVENKKITVKWGSQEKGKQAETLAWGPVQGEGGSEELLLAGQRDSIVQVYNTTNDEALQAIGGTEGPLIGLQTVDNSLVTCNDQGHVLYRDWTSLDIKSSIETKAATAVMRVCQEDPAKVALGGKENDLKIWDVSTGKTIFRAKNVPHDEVGLKVPIWVTDAQFLPQSSGHVMIVTTGHHQVRVYDTRAQRKPMVNLNSGDCPIRCLAVTSNARTAIFGNSIGRVRSMDLRTNRLHLSYRGPSGSVRSVSCHPTLPFVACGGLDRFVYVFAIDTAKRLAATYVKQGVSSVLFASDPRVAVEGKTEEKKGNAKKASHGTAKVSDDDDENDLWAEMAAAEELDEASTNKRRKVEQ